MDDTLRIWLLENRPYTCLRRRLKHYGLLCQKLEPSLSWTTIMRQVYEALDRLWMTDFGVQWNRDRQYERNVRLYGKLEQRTDAWFASRNQMITASEVYKAIASDATRRELINSKLKPPATTATQSTAAPLLWGTRMECIAKQLYEEMTRCTITDVGCIVHPQIPFLGASPDGLIVPKHEDPPRYGRLVEFKCPYSKVYTEIPSEYIHQMQLQMACSGIPECEFAAFFFRRVQYAEWLQSVSKKGIFAVCPNGGVYHNTTTGPLEHWQVTLPPDTSLTFWVLDSILTRFVEADPHWLPTNYPAFQYVWEEVMRHRAEGTTAQNTRSSTIMMMDI